MGEVSAIGSVSFSQGKLNGNSYLPSIPPKPPHSATLYSRSIQDAPFSALVGVIVDARQPSKYPVTARCRVRHQVGCTNRWRLPESLGSDLLGTSQALKAIQKTYSKSVIQIITAENPKIAINRDENQPYSFNINSKVTSLPTKLSPDGINRPVSTASRVTVMSLRTPSRATFTKPLETFYFHTRRSGSPAGPDILLNSLDTAWEVNRAYIMKCATLKKLVEEAEAPILAKYYKKKTSEPLEKNTEQSNHYNNSHKEQDSTLEKERKTVNSGLADPKYLNLPRLGNKTSIDLDISDPTITPHGLAVALGNLYHEDTEVEVQDVIPVLAAAVTLKFTQLEQGCVDIMLENINSRTVSPYYKTAVLYRKDKAITGCERWLEVSLVSELSSKMVLKELPLELLQKTLNSNRLFTHNEFTLYKVLAYWVYFQLNPQIQVMPSYSAVVTFFNGLPKQKSLLETDDGEHYTPLFSLLRIHGITESRQIHDIQMMNIVPKSWIVKALTQHYQSLQTGGDMSVITNFNEGAVRQGFVILEEPQYHSEIFSLHGFHFELKAVRHMNSPGTYTFNIQRLRPGDPLLSFRHNERSTFSMRPERDVKYSMKVQYKKNKQFKTYNTGQLQHTFGLGDKTSKGQVLTMENLTAPIYVSFAFYFPPS